MMLWVDWAQHGCSAPHEVSWGCTHQGFSGAHSVQGGLATWLQLDVASMWPVAASQEEASQESALPKIPAECCKTSQGSASEVRQL